MREGKTKRFYERQKAQSFTYFKINASDQENISGKKYSIYDFINNSFSFSRKRKEAAVSVLEELKQGEASFTELRLKLKAPKSSLFLLLLSLERSGLIEKKEEKYSLSEKFAQALNSYAEWWSSWVK